MYYLQKEGVSFKDLLWIGCTLEEGIKEANKFALNDVDNYHTWCVYEYKYGLEKCDKEILYKTKKEEQTKDYIESIYDDL